MSIDFRLYLVTDRKQSGGRPLVEAVKAALEGGVRAVQLREKDLGGRDLYFLARDLRNLTARYGACLLINDRIDVALAVEADGVHLGQASLPVTEARKLLGPEKLIGVSTHSLDEIAGAAGADFLVFGPVYFTPSKAAYGEPQGLNRLREAVAQSLLPVFAIGGITTEKLAEVCTAGAYGVAMISAIISAPDPQEAAQRLLAALPTGQ
jgi:thiamine-phosphate pyrophosphorylase